MPGKLCKTVHNLHGKWERRQNRRIKISFTGTSKTKFWHEKRANVVVIYLMLQVFTAHTTTRTYTHTNIHSHTTKQTHTKGRQSVWKVTGKANDRRNKMKEGRMNFFVQARIDTKFVCNFRQTRGRVRRREREGDRLLNLCGISRHFKRSTDIDIESMPWHSLCLPRIRGVYVMRECVRMCGDINKSIYAANNCICL